MLSNSNRILVYSPDTDVYNIGLPLVAENMFKEIIVQLNLPQSNSNLYIHLNNLVTSMYLDPDLACIQQESLPQVFQMLFVSSGCDYISYFKGHGKAVFFNTFLQHTSFICGNLMDGSLSDMYQKKTKRKGF